MVRISVEKGREGRGCNTFIVRFDYGVIIIICYDVVVAVVVTVMMGVDTSITHYLSLHSSPPHHRVSPHHHRLRHRCHQSCQG